MKKLVCAIMALFILLSFCACNIGANESRQVSDDTMKQDGDITSETTETEPSETTTKPSVQAPKNDSFDDFEIVVGKVFTSLGDKYENLLYQSADAALKNKNYGIINMAHIWLNELIGKEDDNEPDKFLTVEVFVFEFDTGSEQYKNLKVGEELELDKDNYINDHYPTVITAINNQYVISFYAVERMENLLVSKAETLPEFTLGNLQKAYDDLPVRDFILNHRADVGMAEPSRIMTGARAHRVGVHSIEEFYYEHTGMTHAPVTTEDWLATPQMHLALSVALAEP